jgi:predicted PurR-regulated permease PerM
MIRPVAILWLLLLAVALAGVAWWLIRVSKHKWIKSLIVAVALLLACLLLLLIVQAVYEFRMMIRGRSLATQLEHYRTSHGEYPISLSTIGINDTKEGIFYQRDYESPSVFYLWFNTGFGTVAQYDSETRTWHGPR